MAAAAAGFEGWDAVARGVEVGDRLGAGEFGTVYRAVGLHHVVKVFRNAADAEMVRRELAMSALPPHPHVAQTLGYATLAAGGMGIAMQPGGSDLVDSLLSKRAVASAAAWPTAHAPWLANVMAGMLDGLAHVHRHGVWHLDVKVENYLIEGAASDAPLVRLCDFGLAHSDGWRDARGRLFGRLADGVERLRRGVSRRIFGSRSYMLRRELLLDPAYDAWRDRWALGIALFAVAYLHFVYEDPLCEGTSDYAHYRALEAYARRPAHARTLEALRAVTPAGGCPRHDAFDRAIDGLFVLDAAQACALDAVANDLRAWLATAPLE